MSGHPSVETSRPPLLRKMDNRRSASRLGEKGGGRPGGAGPWDAGHDSRAAAEGEFYGRTTAFRPAMIQAMPRSITKYAPVRKILNAGRTGSDGPRPPDREVKTVRILCELGELCG